MDTLDFLRAILPSAGLYVLADFRKGMKNGAYHNAFDNLEDLASAALDIDRRGVTVFHACASFAERRQRKVRVAENAAFVRSQWLDLDVGEGKDYATRKDAGAAIKRICQELSLPAPLVVSSGAGFHCYWTFTEDVPTVEAKKSSTAFAAALKKLKIPHDSSRTADMASILRPPGTHWRKVGEREVRVVRENKPMSYEAFCAAVADCMGTTSEQDAAMAKLAALTGEFSTGPRDYPPSSTEQILRFCPTMAHVAELQGNVPEPLWRAMLGLVKHTIEGSAKAHELSQGHDGYDAAETQSKLDSWNKGPTTCNEFQRHCDLCESCPKAGTVTSPIHLGYTADAAPSAPITEDEPEEPQTTPAPSAPADFSTYANKQPHELPANIWPVGYRWADGLLQHAVTSEDGQVDWVPFSRILFYAYTSVVLDDGTIAMRCCAQVRKGFWRSFDVETKSIADPRSLATILGSYGIMTIGRNGKSISAAFMADLHHNLQAAAFESETISAYGWYDNGFVLGDKRITPKGDAPVVVSAKIPSEQSRLFTEKGSAEEWSEIVNKVYNRPGVEPYQFAICAAFGAPLISLMNIDQWNGIPIGLISRGGVGKTTVGLVACSIYGQSPAFLINASSTGITLKALINKPAIMRHLPMVMDEVAQRETQDLSQIMFALSNGRVREGMRADGTPMDDGRRWSTTALLTGNESILSRMEGGDRQVVEAAGMRCFEIEIAENAMDLFSDTDVKTLIDHNLLPHQHGVVGRKYLQAVMKQRDKIAKMLLRERARFKPDSADATRERYLLDAMITAVFGGRLAKRLGFLDFDMDALEAWAIKHIKQMRGARNSRRMSTHDLMHKMLSDLSNRVVQTNWFRDGRKSKGIEEPLTRTPPRAPVGRIAYEDKVCLFTVAGIREWCAENKLSYDWFIDSLDQHHYIEHTRGGQDEKQRIFKGTTVPGSATKCVEFVFDKVVTKDGRPALRTVKGPEKSGQTKKTEEPEKTT